MRKRLITPSAESIRTRDEGLLDVVRAAVIEITSEQTDCPIEAALSRGIRRVGVRQMPGAKPFGWLSINRNV